MPWALVVAIFLTQAQAAHIKAAREAMDDLKYPEAKALLQKARQQPGLKRAELVEILWLQGLVAASLSQPDAARASFRALFAIEPEHQPTRDYPPKVMSPYYEARGWIATNKPLGFAALPATLEAGRVKRIGVKVLADPLALVTGVRIHVVGAETTEHKLENLAATRDVDAETVSWWAELVGERNAELARIGSEAQPLVETAKKAEPVAVAPTQGPLFVDDKPMSAMRTGAFAAAAASVASFGIGLVFGIRSNTMANALRSRTRDADGVVIGWTQSEAINFELQQRREAGVANALLVGAAVLLGVAVVLFILGSDS